MFRPGEVLPRLGIVIPRLVTDWHRRTAFLN
jgi:hypothetical protein